MTDGSHQSDLQGQPPAVPRALAALPETVRLGELHLFEVGSVGSALLYFLRMLPIEARVSLVDFDTVEYANLNRSPIFTAQQAAAKAPKEMAGRDCLASHLPATAHQMTYQEFVDMGQENSPDVVILVANEYSVRASVQFNRPP